MKINSDIILALQQGIEITSNPFSSIAANLNMKEDRVVSQLSNALKSGLARRFGAVFDSHKLGYSSTLCAVDVPRDDIERVASLLTPHPGITHCYEREGHPNLWFTMTALKNGLSKEITTLQTRIPNATIINLPATQRFKIATIMNIETGRSEVPAKQPNSADTGKTDVPDFSEKDKAVIRAMQGTIPICPAPFAAIAERVDLKTEDLLSRLRDWQCTGIIRRIGLILRHREAGFSANGMCVWEVEPDSITKHGVALASCPEVTHCYHRPAHANVPFNLYAMVHADSLEAARGILEDISRHAGLPTGRMLVSVREFKKSSPLFFPEATA